MRPARVAAGALAAASVAWVASGCSSAPKGLGKAACPYVRPRIIRLDNRTKLAADRGQAGADISAVAQDVAIYVRQLPDKGKGTHDRVLVRFSAALTRFAATPAGSGPARARASAALDAAETALVRQCRVPGY